MVPLWPTGAREVLLNVPNDLIAWMQAATKSEVAALAPEVFIAAAGGDPVSRRVLAAVEEDLANDATACARKLGRGPVDIVFAGSVVLRQGKFARRIARRIRATLPGASARPLERESAWGAVVMARRAAERTRPGPSKVPMPIRPKPAAGNDATRIPPSRELSPTERRNPRSSQLDRIPLRKAIELMVEEDGMVGAAIRAQLGGIEKLIRRVSTSLSREGACSMRVLGPAGDWVSSTPANVLRPSERPPNWSRASWPVASEPCTPPWRVPKTMQPLVRHPLPAGA